MVIFPLLCVPSFELRCVFYLVFHLYLKCFPVVFSFSCFPFLCLVCFLQFSPRHILYIIGLPSSAFPLALRFTARFLSFPFSFHSSDSAKRRLVFICILAPFDSDPRPPYPVKSRVLPLDPSLVQPCQFIPFPMWRMSESVSLWWACPHEAKA